MANEIGFAFVQGFVPASGPMLATLRPRQHRGTPTLGHRCLHRAPGLVRNPDEVVANPHCIAKAVKSENPFYGAFTSTFHLDFLRVSFFKKVLPSLLVFSQILCKSCNTLQQKRSGRKAPSIQPDIPSSKERLLKSLSLLSTAAEKRAQRVPKRCNPVHVA